MTMNPEKNAEIHPAIAAPLAVVKALATDTPLFEDPAQYVRILELRVTMQGEGTKPVP